jgi:hypothetical protein
MNQTARLPSQARALRLGAIPRSLGATLHDTVALLFVREAHAYYAAPRALRAPLSKRAQRFMRGGE